MTEKNIPNKAAEELAKKYGYDRLLIVGLKNEAGSEIATYAKTSTLTSDLTCLVDWLKDHLED